MPLGNTSYLQIPLIAENDNQKYLLSNDGFQAFDDALNRLITLDLSAADATLTESQLTRYQCFRASGATVPRTLTIPDTVGGGPAITTNRFIIIDNRGTDALTITHGGAGNDVVLPANTVSLVYADGTDIVGVASASGFNMGVRDEGGADFVTNPGFLNFVGAGVEATLNGIGADVTVTMAEVQDEGSQVQTDTQVFNFIGAGVTAVANGSGVDVTVPGGAAGIDFEDSGVSVVTGATVANFIGNSVNVTNNAGDADITVTLSEVQDEGGSVQTDTTFFNFVGAGVTASANGNGVDVTIPGGGITGIEVREEGSVVVTSPTLDFRGNNTTVTDVGGVARVTQKAPTIQDEGTPVQADPTFINFTGPGVTASISGGGVEVAITGGGGSSTIPVDDDGVNIVAAADRFNFTGPGVVVSAAGNTATVNVPGGGGTDIETQKDGTQVVTATDTLNFTGSGVNVTNPSGDVTEINIPGGSGASNDNFKRLNGAELILEVDCSVTSQIQYDVTGLEQFDEVFIQFDGLGATGADADPCFRLSTDGGATFPTTAGNYSTQINGSLLSAVTDRAALGNSGATDVQQGFAQIKLPGLTGQTAYETTNINSAQSWHSNGMFQTATITDALRVFNNGGVAFDEGTIRIYGINYKPRDIAQVLGFSGARADQLISQTLTGSATTIFDFTNGDTFDDGGWFDSTLAPTDFVVPLGVTKARIDAGFQLNAASSTFTGEFQITQNGSPVATQIVDANATLFHAATISTGVIDVQEGDVFRMQFVNTGTSSNTLQTRTFFSISDASQLGGFGAGVEVIGTVDLTSFTGTQDFTDLGDYSDIILITDDADSDNANNLNIVLSSDNGSTFDTVYKDFYSGQSGTSTSIQISYADTGINRGFTRLIGFNKPVPTVASAGLGSTAANFFEFRNFMGNTPTAHNAIRVQTAGTMVSGTVYILGVRDNSNGVKTRVTVLNDNTNSRTSSGADEGALIACNDATMFTYTVAPDSTADFAVGSVINLQQYGAGTVTVAAGAGVTIRSPSTLTTRSQYSIVSLTKLGPNEWTITGDLTP